MLYVSVAAVAAVALTVWLSYLERRATTRQHWREQQAWTAERAKLVDAAAAPGLIRVAPPEPEPLDREAERLAALDADLVDPDQELAF